MLCVTLCAVGIERRTVYLQPVVGPDSIGWAGAVLGDVTHLPGECISPPPFGTQCTVHAHDAIRVCLHDRRCTALTCPDQTPYRRGQPHKYIHGPICQARNASLAAWRGGHNLERRHGMCKPRGCDSFFLTEASLRQSGNSPYTASVLRLIVATPLDATILLLPESSALQGAAQRLLRLGRPLQQEPIPAEEVQLQPADPPAERVVVYVSVDVPSDPRPMRQARRRALPSLTRGPRR